jgi:pyridinium-3,5-biscarboxylic acid mononucleotide sulfurtransferase
LYLFIPAEKNNSQPDRMMRPDALAPDLAEKYDALRGRIAGCGRIAIAYSGGVDSALLADVAHETLGSAAHMVLFDSPVTPRHDIAAARCLAEDRGWNFHVIATGEFARADFLANDTLRCYYCKAEKLAALKQWAAARDIGVLAHGENADDLKDTTRTGLRAAAERGAIAPLAEAGLTKAEIRELSRLRGLPTWEKASFACLATRIPENTPITEAVLRRIETVEDTLRECGIHQYRARHHGDICRIETDPADFSRMLDAETRQAVFRACRDAGYRHAVLDLAGYRSPG